MNTLRCCIPVLFASLALSPAALAQAAATPAATPNKPEEVIQLDEFNVAVEPERGYVASEAITGPRVATKIADLPYSVSVITSEFMRDFDILNLAGDLNGFSASLTGVTDEGTFVLRGMTTNNNFILRDGFYRLGMVDRVNTDRIEIIKGPNSAIYGATNPSGMVNIVSKLPTSTPYQSIRYTTGPYQMNRVETNLNQPLGTLDGIKFNNLISISGSDAYTPSTYPTSSQNRVFDDTMVAKLKDGSTITAEYEWSRVFVVPGFATTIPFQGVKSTLTPVTRPDLTYFNDVGNVGALKNRSSYSAYLTYEKRYNPVWSTRVNGYWYNRPELQFDAAANSSTFDPTTQTFSARSVQWDTLNQNGGAFQLDTLADYALFDGRVKSKTLFTLDYSQNWRMREVKDFNTNLYPAILPVSIVNPVYTIPPFSAYNIPSRFDKTRADTAGAFVSEQLRLFNERLIAFVSLRRDVVTYNFDFGNQYNPKGGALKTPGQVLHYLSRAWEPSIGYNYKLTKNLALYGSYSQSFAPQLQVGKLGTPPLPNETATGCDYGIKASLLEDRLVFTAGGYYINRDGIKTTITDPVTGLSDTVAAGSTNSKGVEFEGSWHATDRLMLVFNYGYVNAKITNNGNSTTDVGQVPVGVPVSGASVSGTYRFGGRLNGLSFHLNIGYTGRAYPFSTQTTFQRYIVAPGYYLVNPGITYAWKVSHNIKESIRLSAKNALDRNYVTTTYGLGTPRGVYFSYSLDH